MARFRYRMQKVLDFRLRKEEDAKQALSGAKHQCDVEQDALDQLNARLASAQKQMNQQLQGGRSGDVQMSNDYAKSLEDKIKAQQAKLKKAETAREDAQKNYIQASKDRTILEKHREKEFKKWQDEEKRLEGINLDEMASTGFLKKRRIEQEDRELEGLDEDGEPIVEVSENHSSWIEGLLQSAQKMRDEKGRQA